MTQADAELDCVGSTSLIRWHATSSEPGAWDTPRDISTDNAWRSAAVPGTAASLHPELPLDGHPDYDARDWWYQCRLPKGAGRLHFAGLATIARVWIDDEVVLDSANMFRAHDVEVPDGDEGRTLTIVFRSLATALGERRPRPRWKTNLVSHQRLRWFRTTLLGRIPGWTPPIAPVGPWRGVTWTPVRALDVVSHSIRSHLSGSTGIVLFEAKVRLPARADSIVSGTLRCSGSEVHLDFEPTPDGTIARARIEISDPDLWWPHTHGHPTLHPYAAQIESGEDVWCTEGSIGFRNVRVDRSNGAATLVVNDRPIFCRGACWTTNDIVTLVGSSSDRRRTLEILVRAHGNMVRVGGTMVYEVEDFYDLCDELGIMVWQDFMFANMDYPMDDPDFREDVEAEIDQVVGRLLGHPSVVTLCGGSEVEQQAAMFGAAADAWRSSYFTTELPNRLGRVASDIPYWSSTPTGGVLPFHLSEGLGHYYGVGAYRRSLDDARLSPVRFSPEALGFSNVPEPQNLSGMSSHGTPPPHAPAWKAGVPRDSNAGWDFEDIRDHYIGRLHGVDPVELRAQDLDRYVMLARTVTGRVMEHVFDEWRLSSHPCAGALVWFLQDLRPGAGWGIIDSDKNAKPVLHHLGRAWAPVRLTILDRGLDGLMVALMNESAQAVSGNVTVRMYNAESNIISEGETGLAAPAGGEALVSVEAVLGHFADPTYAYRFGPLRHAAISATLEVDGEVGIDEAALTAVHWSDLQRSLPPTRLDASVTGDVGSIEATGLARSVRLDVTGGPSPNYFDLVPGQRVSFRLMDTPGDGSLRIKGFVEAENAPDGFRVTVD